MHDRMTLECCVVELSAVIYKRLEYIMAVICRSNNDCGLPTVILRR